MNDSVWHRLRAHASARADHPAVVSDRLEWTYRELLAEVHARATAWREAGIDHRATVGVRLDDEAWHLVATLALLAVGARQIVLASHDARSLQVQIATQVGVTHVLAADAASALPGTAWLAWPRTADVACVPPCALPPATGTALLYLKTSGTTGRMNIVAFADMQIAAQSARHADYRDERLLRLASIEHNNSKRHRLYSVWAGGTNVFRPRGHDIVDFVRRAGVTCLDISRMHAADLAASAPSTALAAVTLRTGGSAVPWSVRRAVIERVTARLCVRYAATECGTIAMALPGDHDSDETSGRLLPGVELQIVDADDRALPVGCAGEIRLRAAGMATSYLNDAPQSARRFRHGWFYPGDVGCLRTDGQLIVHGRTDDMIVMNGLNIFPAEIERVLEAHPAVAEAAAFPVPSAVHGQIPVAAVQLHPDTRISAIELQAYSREHLGLRSPRRIVVLACLPKSPQGKVLKSQLVDSLQPSAVGS